MRTFHTEGSCDPSLYYMVESPRQTQQIMDLIENHKYFIINRPPECGKTTMLKTLRVLLKDRYYMLLISFKGTSEAVFQSPDTFLSYLNDKMEEAMRAAGCPASLITLWLDRSPWGEEWDRIPFACLSKRIDRLCGTADRGIVLMIDEVDSAPDNAVMASFLGTLRQNYLDWQDGDQKSFQSVVLAGVADISLMRWKNRPESEYRHIVPWNIAAPFSVDMNFSADEIAEMLRDYETDHLFKLDIPSVSQEIHRFTSGYPVLVSWICQWLDGKGPESWTVAGVQKAGQAFLKSDFPLLEDLDRNMENHPELKDMFLNILYCGAKYDLRPPRPLQRLGLTYGYIKDDGKNKVAISNLLFEKYLSDSLTPRSG